MPRGTPLVRRRLHAIVRSRMADEPVILIAGPRTVGKSTLLREIATDLGATVIDLDDPATRGLAADDPTLFVAGRSPICIDEVQHVPLLLDAIKAELNRELAPGRYLLTGSTRFQSLPRSAQSLTGRLHIVTAWPFAQSELEGTSNDLLPRALEDVTTLRDPEPSRTSRAEYVERVLAGGLPIALQRQGAARANWFDDYVNLVIERDVVQLSAVRQRSAMPALLAQLAAQTAQVLTVAKAARQTGLESSTAEAYVRLLESVFLVHRLPAWGRTLRTRAVASPKVHVVDTGVAARLLGLTSAKIDRREPGALTDFGHVLETFCVNEILKQASWQESTLRAGHWRTHDGTEVDLVIESFDGDVVGFEIKSSAGATQADASGLRALRAAVGERFRGGIVLHAGPYASALDHSIVAVPIDRLWT